MAVFAETASAMVKCVRLRLLRLIAIVEIFFSAIRIIPGAVFGRGFAGYVVLTPQSRVREDVVGSCYQLEVLFIARFRVYRIGVVLLGQLIKLYFDLVLRCIIAKT